MQKLVEEKLTELGVASESIVAEFVTVMVNNNKSRDQISAELNDFIGPEDGNALLDWLFKHLKQEPTETSKAPIAKRPIEEEEDQSDPKKFKPIVWDSEQVAKKPVVGWEDKTKSSKFKEPVITERLQEKKRRKERPATQPPVPVPVPVQAPVECKFGANCMRADCQFSHPSPAKLMMMQQQPKLPVATTLYNKSLSVPCKFWPNCLNPACPFEHPQGSAAVNINQIPCRFDGQCKRPGCPYKHYSTSQRVFALDDSETEKVEIAKPENSKTGQEILENSSISNFASNVNGAQVTIKQK